MLELFPAAMLPPVTFKLPLAVRFAPAPMVKVPLLDVTRPVTAPAPFQFPPVIPRVLLKVPVVRLTVPPLSVAAPLTEPPVPVRVPLPMLRVPVKAPLRARAALEASVAPFVEVTVPLKVLPVLLKVVTPVRVMPLPFIVALVTAVVPATDPDALPLRVVPEASVRLPLVKAELSCKVP